VLPKLNAAGAAKVEADASLPLLGAKLNSGMLAVVEVAAADEAEPPNANSGANGASADDEAPPNVNEDGAAVAGWAVVVEGAEKPKDGVFLSAPPVLSSSEVAPPLFPPKENVTLETAAAPVEAWAPKEKEAGSVVDDGGAAAGGKTNKLLASCFV